MQRHSVRCDKREKVGLFLEPIPIHIGQGIQSGHGKTAASPFMANVCQFVQDAVSHAMPWDQQLRLRGVDPSSVPFRHIFAALATFHDSNMVQSLPCRTCQVFSGLGTMVQERQVPEHGQVCVRQRGPVAADAGTW